MAISTSSVTQRKWCDYVSNFRVSLNDMIGNHLTTFLLFQALLLESLEYDILWYYFLNFKIKLAEILLLIQTDMKSAVLSIKFSKAHNAKVSSIICIILEAAGTQCNLPRTC